MTYYDTRPEDEAVIVRRKGNVDKVQEKTNGPSVSSSLSGPRQPKDLRRRPLPTDPVGSQSARPARPEKMPSAPAPAQPVPVRPFEHAHVAPAVHSDPMHHPHPLDRPYDMAAHGPSHTAPPPVKMYETPDDFHRQWDQPEQALPAGSMKHHPHDRYHYDERPEPYAMNPYQARNPGYDSMPTDYRTSKPEVMHSPDYAPEADMHARVPYEMPQSHNRHPMPPVEQRRPMAYGQVSKIPAHPHGLIHEPPSDYAHYSAAPVERERPQSQHGNALVRNGQRNPMTREQFHAEYAAMQPRVEDEEEEGPPPPPPVHRSLVQHSQMAQPPSYQAYFPGQPRAVNDANISASRRPVSSHSSHSQSRGRFPDPPQAGVSVPASLVAGYDPVVVDAEADRIGHENQVIRRNSAMYEEPPVPFPEPLSYTPPYPADPPNAVDEQRRSLGSRGSARSDSRVVQRKSVSPKPPSVMEREASIPFSPDSYDVLNPNAARSAVTRDPKPAYDTPSQAMDAAMRSEAEAARDPGPIIGDDGREIDPTDHLPTDTWAPEPEKKNRKPEVIIRFKNSRANPATRPAYKPVSAEPPPGNWRRQSHVTPDPTGRTPPRGRESYGGYGYGTPNSDSARSYRKSVSPSPGSHSPSNLYAPNTGPPIPAKVPIAPPVNQGYSTMHGNPGMAALSRELNSIDIGSVGCSPGRGTRRYVPKASVTGYAI